MPLMDAAIVFFADIATNLDLGTRLDFLAFVIRSPEVEVPVLLPHRYDQRPPTTRPPSRLPVRVLS